MIANIQLELQNVTEEARISTDWRAARLALLNLLAGSNPLEKPFGAHIPCLMTLSLV